MVHCHRQPASHPWPSMTSHAGPWPAMARKNDWMPDWMAMSTLKMQPPTLKESRQAMAGTLGSFFGAQATQWSTVHDNPPLPECRATPREWLVVLRKTSLTKQSKASHICEKVRTYCQLTCSHGLPNFGFLLHSGGGQSNHVAQSLQ